MSKNIKKVNIDTTCLHGGQTPDTATGARAVPIYQTTSYVFRDTDHAANLFALKDRRYEKIIEELYIHSVACGAASQAMAKYLRINDSHNFFAIGLLHDIGKLLVLQVLSEITKNTRGVDITLAKNIMDSLHNKAGYMLLEKWNFPKIYSQIALAHENILDLEDPEEELAVIYLANRYVRRLGYSLIPDDGQDILNEKPAKLLRLNVEILEKVAAAVKEHVDKIKSVL